MSSVNGDNPKVTNGESSPKSARSGNNGGENSPTTNQPPGRSKLSSTLSGATSKLANLMSSVGSSLRKSKNMESQASTSDPIDAAMAADVDRILAEGDPSKPDLTFSENFVTYIQQAYKEGKIGLDDINSHTTAASTQDDDTADGSADKKAKEKPNAGNNGAKKSGGGGGGGRGGRGLLAKRINFALASVNFSSCDTETCVQMIRIPSIKMYKALNKKIRTSDRVWIQGFLESGGLVILLNTVGSISSRKVHLSDAMVLLECIGCVKNVLNNKLGLEYIINNKDYLNMLTTALDTPNIPVKEQVFKILSAISIYDDDGLQMTLGALESYKVSTRQRYRFSLIVNELRRHGTEQQQYGASVLGLINCLIEAHDDLATRDSIRREFIGLNLLDVLDSLRGTESADLETQIDNFYEARDTDDNLLDSSKPQGVDLDSHADVFNAVFQKVCNTPNAEVFLSVLQSLLNIDPEKQLSDTQWSIVDKIAKKGTILDSSEDAQQLLDHVSSNPVVPKMLLSTGMQTETGTALADPPPPPKIPPPAPHPPLVSGSAPPPPPPPPPLPGATNGGPVAFPYTAAPPPPPAPPPPGGPPAPPPPPGGPPPPPPPPGSGPPAPPPPPGTSFNTPQSLVKTIVTPRPQNKMKTFNWTKLPTNVVSRDSCIWKYVNDMPDAVPVSYNALEELFCQASPDTAPKKETQKTKKSTEINLLDPKDSLKVNIFLRQFRASHQQIVEMLRTGDEKAIGVEKLKGLLNIMPTQDQKDQISTYEGDQTQLGEAERFYALLLTLPAYQLRVEGMIMRCEFPPELRRLSEEVGVLRQTTRGVLESSSLKEFLRFTLHAGNFINSGSYAGNAVGFKIASLIKLVETRSNKPRVTLLHYLVQEAEFKHTQSLAFIAELSQPLKTSARLSLATIESEVNELNKRFDHFKKRLQTKDDDLQNQYTSFIQETQNSNKSLSQDLGKLDVLREDLAEYFGEDKKKFKLEECLGTLCTFCDRVQTCQNENEMRKIQEEKAAKRKQEQAELKAKQPAPSKTPTTPTSEDGIIDSLLSEIQSGSSIRRTRTRRKQHGGIKVLPSFDRER